MVFYVGNGACTLPIVKKVFADLKGSPLSGCSRQHAKVLKKPIAEKFATYQCLYFENF
jgi:hypothetical protein